MHESPPSPVVNGPAGAAPARPSRSIRRTSSVDMQFPGAFEDGLMLYGSARDAITVDADRPPLVVDSATTEIAIGTNRSIEAITCQPSRANIGDLVGSRGGGHLRAALDEVLPGERASGSPLYLLLDDISGTSLIAGWSIMRNLEPPPVNTDGPRRPSEGVCIGFSPGSSALLPRGQSVLAPTAKRVVPLVNPADPDGWHDFKRPAGTASMRRARRIDVWRESNGDGDVIVIDSAFQDSAHDDDGGRTAIHEYLLRATADAVTFELLSVEPDPRVLPFTECPSAILNARNLVGTPIHELRTTVLERLGRMNGCTHLNDALRALAEVPTLVARLDATLNA
ncbi:MAG TPA: DUF2889 domain-containing protein [Ilumatobacter sp.]|nr:DUF2889 domain-containing protein [Ilumatobacter sp.]